MPANDQGGQHDPMELDDFGDHAPDHPQETAPVEEIETPEIVSEDDSDSSSCDNDDSEDDPDYETEDEEDHFDTAGPEQTPKENMSDSLFLVPL